MEFCHFFVNMEQPARSCPRPPRLAWLAGELAMAGGSNTLTLAQTDHHYFILKKLGL